MPEGEENIQDNPVWGCWWERKKVEQEVERKGRLAETFSLPRGPGMAHGFGWNRCGAGRSQHQDPGDVGGHGLET